LIAASLGVISLLYYATTSRYFVLHEIVQRVYYLPIVIGALCYGLRGGLLAAGLAAVLYLPHVFARENGFPNYEFVNQLCEVLLFFVFGGLTGGFSDKQRQQREELQATAARLVASNEDLQKSFDSLRRAERLSALGRLSADLVHEIRNPLSVIANSLELAGRITVDAGVRAEMMTYMKEEISRLNEMVTHFLEFARSRPPALDTMAAERVMDNICKILSDFVASGDVKTVCTSQPFTCSVAVDLGQIREVIVNLVLNATEAMPLPGVIEVSAAQQGGHFVVSVKDEGTGIPEEKLARIFEPFYTTKIEGTGLGLPIVQQIMQQHGGRIEVKRNADRGMTFSLYFPCLSPQKQTNSALSDPL
jgi:signal transduction histidine kinase